MYVAGAFLAGRSELFYVVAKYSQIYCYRQVNISTLGPKER